MKRSLDQLTEIARQAVNIGNKRIRTTRPQIVTEKADRDTFTEVDIKIEREIRAYLGEVTPDVGFEGEEEGFSYRNNDNGYYWALDPIDGTSNFVHGIPLCAVQIALIQSGIAVVAAISMPYMNLHYWAAQGLGAFANGTSIKVSNRASLNQAIVSIGDYATGVQADKKNARRIAVTAALASKVERIRMLGSAAHDLAWVADGRLDAAVILSNNTLDIAPGVLLAREAGAIAMDTTGAPYGPDSTDVIVASPNIAASILTLTQLDGPPHV
ncbi:inositol monophosphatase family protein [Saccharothrix stipae]